MMKRHAFYAAMAAAIVFVGCSDDEYLSEGVSSQGNESAEITFSGASGVITRTTSFPVGSAAEKLNGKFVVVGYKNYSEVSPIKVFDYYTVSYENTEAGTDTYSSSNTTGWEYVGYAPFSVSSATAQTVKYWDNKATSYDFYAFSLGSAGEYNSSSNANGVKVTDLSSNVSENGGYYSLEGNADGLSKCYISDMKTIEKGSGGYTNSAVVMTFRSLAAKVRMAIYETVPGYSVTITKFYTSTDDSGSNTTPTLIGTVNKSGTYKVNFDKTTANYNKAKVTFTAAETNATDSKLQFSSSSYNGGTLGEDAANATYCGAAGGTTANEYTTILPNENNGVLTLKVDYTLTSTDNSGETITVTGATAVVPAAYAQWKPGYAYTYLFKITNETNGTTGDSDDPTGLTAISFDACVVEQVETPIETTTTVATPSITTYAYNPTTKKGSTNEYYAGDFIYASVDNNGTLVALSSSNVALYTLSTTTGAEMTETAVIAALEHGKLDNSTYTLTSNSKTLTVTPVTEGLSYVNTVPTSESTTISLGNNALMWTANKNTTYAVVYNYTVDGGNNKKYACKVVTVGGDVPAIATISDVKASTSAQSLDFSLENVPSSVNSVTATLTKITPESSSTAGSVAQDGGTTTYKATFSNLTLTKDEVYVVTFTYKRANGDVVTLTKEFTVQAGEN